MLNRSSQALAAILFVVVTCWSAAHGEESVRQTIAAATVAPTPSQQREIILSLKAKPSAEAVTWFEKWKVGEIFLHEDPSGAVTPVLLSSYPARRMHGNHSPRSSWPMVRPISPPMATLYASILP